MLRGSGTARVRTPAVATAILLALGKGQSRTAAAAVAGIHRSTLYDWTREDQAFAEACDVAEASAEAMVAEALLANVLLDWKAALSWLERRRRADWRPPNAATEASGPDAGPATLDDARGRIARVLDQYAATVSSPSGAGQPDTD
jgi:hypothetical protein